MAHGAAVRDRKKERVWRKILRGRGEGESIRAYCRLQGVNEAAFYWWRRELARRDADKPRPDVAAFVPVVAQAAADRVEGMTIELRGGRMLRLPAMAVGQMVELICALESDGKAGAA